MLYRFLFLLIAVIAASSDCESQEIDSVQHCVIILTDDQLTTSYYALNGNWEFYPNELIGSKEMVNHLPKSLIKVPSYWTNKSDSQSIQSGTYRIKVKLLDGQKQSALAISMPEVYCSYDLWVNGSKLGQNGIVAKTKSGSKPQWKPETYVFKSESDTLEIIIHLSNFYHHRAGINKPILLGHADLLIQRKNRIETSSAALLIGIGCLALAGGIFFFQLKNISLLFYVLLCLAWILRSAFSNHYQIVQWFPDINWYFCVRMEYISVYLATLFGSLLVGSLFPRDVNKVFRMFFIIASTCFTLFTIIASPVLFTEFVQLYVSLSFILLVSIIVIIIRAYSESREGAGFLLITALLAVGIFGYVILAYQGLFELDELVFNIGFLIQFMLTLVTVYIRIHKMKTTLDYDVMTFDQAIKRRE